MIACSEIFFGIGVGWLSSGCGNGRKSPRRDHAVAMTPILPLDSRASCGSGVLATVAAAST